LSGILILKDFAFCLFV